MTKDSVVFAATDVGSNATKVLIWEIGADKRAVQRLEKRYPLRLDDAFRAGRLEPATVTRLIEMFGCIGELCRQHRAREIRAAATDAFRAASNGHQVADAIEMETGIRVAILSPEEEGRLIAEGVRAEMPDRGHGLLILDIGGGSADVILSQGDRLRSLSLPLGAVRLRETFIRSDPISPPDYEAMHTHVQETVARRIPGPLGKGPVWPVGCGGGVRFLHAMCGVLRSSLSQNQAIRFDHLEHLSQAIRPLRVDSLMQSYGLDQERAEIIVPGAVVLLALMKRLALVELHPSARGIRHGLLADFLKRLS